MAVARTCSVAVPGSVMRTMNVAVVAPGRQREGLLGLVDRDVGIAGAVQPHPGFGRPIGEQADVDPERRARADVVGRGQPDDRDVAALVGRQRERV